MAANGANKETADEITKLLGISDLEKFNDEVYEYINKYKEDIEETSGSRSYSDDEPKFSLNIANSVWYNSDNSDVVQKFSDKFVKTVTDKYDGTAEIVNNSDAVERINSWCDEKTNHKIPVMISDSDFVACLTNAVYFNANWKYEFNKNYTQKDIFTDRNGKENEIDFMNSSLKYYLYYEDEELQMVSLPYANCDISMYIALTSQSNVDFEKYLDKMEQKKVYISMPKFKTEYSVSLYEPLKELGLSKAFDSSLPNFNDMFKHTDNGFNSFISKVLHKTYIDVNEKETEAAAVTSVDGIVTTSVKKPEEIYFFEANKPFTYFIRDDSTGDILFIGEYAYTN